MRGIGIGIGLSSFMLAESKPNAAPASLTAKVLSDTSIKLDLTNSGTNQDGSKFYYRVTGAGSFTLKDTVLGIVTTHTVTGLTENTSYDFYVTNFKGSKESAASNIVSSFTFPPLSKFLFLGYYSQITGGHMPNILDSGATYLTVSGSAGSETYQCPNTADYIAADTDYIWFKTNAAQRTTTTAELVGYDLQRSPVKYDDASPYQIRMIGILKSTATLSSAELDALSFNFNLPLFWTGSFNDYGYVKENRAFEQALFTPEEVWPVAIDDGYTKAWYDYLKSSTITVTVTQIT